MTLPSPYILGPLWGFSELGLSLLKRAKGNAVSKDRASLFVIWAVNLASVGLGVYLAFHWQDWASPWLRRLYPVGFGLFVAGLCFRWRCILYLGRFFTVNVAIAADHQLIQTGNYRHVRHPSYTGGLVMLLGYCICVGNLASLLAIFIPCASVILWRIHVEEAALLQAFGESYRAYMQRTKRLIPWVY